MYYLIKERKYFYDPHGHGDFGGIKKYVSTDKKWKDLKKRVELYWHEVYDEEENYWRERLDELKNIDTTDWYATDGYNHTVTSYEIRELTELEYWLVKYLMEEYDKF